MVDLWFNFHRFFKQKGVNFQPEKFEIASFQLKG
jgi:hypothetical protein